MKTFTSPFATALFTCALFCVSLRPVARAQNNPYSKWKTTKAATSEAAPAAKSRAYSPARGSSTRQGIADAMRRDVGKFAGVYVIFTFGHIKASGDWAYAEATPTSQNGKSKYEPVSALLKRSGTTWKVVDRVAGGGDVTPAAALKQLKARNPKAPGDIFPR